MANTYFDLDAALGSEEEDEDYDEETGEPTKPRKERNVEDSSEEEDDDDDEEEQRRVSHAPRVADLEFMLIYTRSLKVSSQTRTKMKVTANGAKRRRSGLGRIGRMRTCSTRTTWI